MAKLPMTSGSASGLSRRRRPPRRNRHSPARWVALVAIAAVAAYAGLLAWQEWGSALLRG